MHPINQKREGLSSFNTLFTELREDEATFFNYFKMSISSCGELNHFLKDALKYQDSKMRNCIKTAHDLTQQTLAHGCRDGKSRLV